MEDRNKVPKKKKRYDFYYADSISNGIVCTEINTVQKEVYDDLTWQIYLAWVRSCDKRKKSFYESHKSKVLTSCIVIKDSSSGES